MLRFGTMRGLVDGLEAVLPDGTIHDGLSGLKKDSRGYSLDQLLIGAEGTLGIVTAARLGLFPAIHSRAVAWLGLTSPQAALDVLRAVQGQSSRIEGFEILPRESLNAVLGHVPDTRAPLSIIPGMRWSKPRPTTPMRSSRPNCWRACAPLIEQGLVGDATISASEAQAEAFWRIRDSLSEAERAAFGPATQHDISVPVDAMPEFMAGAAAEVEKAFPGSCLRFRPSRRRQYPFSCPRRLARRAGLAEPGRSGGDAPGRRPGHGCGRFHIGRAWHRPDEEGRTNGCRPNGCVTCVRSSALDPKGIMNPGKLVG